MSVSCSDHRTNFVAIYAAKAVVLFMAFALSACSSVYVVHVSNLTNTPYEDIENRMEAIYQEAGLIPCGLPWCKSYIQNRQSVKSIWEYPPERGPNWNRGVLLLEHYSDAKLKIRVVFQKGGDEETAQRKAKHIAEELENEIGVWFSSVEVFIEEQYGPDFR